MPVHGPVLAVTDLSSGAADALVQGFALARALGTPFTVGHAIPEAFRIRMLFPHDAGIDQPTQDALYKRAEDVTRVQLRAVLGAEADAVPVTFETGSAHAAVLAIADRVGAGLIALGPGATAQRVARSAQRTVLVARPSVAGGAVLGASDFSDPSLPALRAAAAEAARREAPLRLIHCLDIDATAYLAAAGAPGMLAAAPFPESAVAELEHNARERMRTVSNDVRAEVIVSRLSPLMGIVREAAATPTSLIVVGTHGRSGLARLALGSVAESVMRDAPCSVLVVPLAHD
jgi:nucleotide-binding universal stress UspA family protein